MEGRRAGGERGWGEIVVLFIFAVVIGFAFLWAFALHEKPPPEPEEPAFDPTATTLVPLTLPQPSRYEVDGGVNLRRGPGTSTELLGKVRDGKKVTVICKTVGEDVTGADGATNLWLRIDLGQLGFAYATALYVDTGDDIENPYLIGDCALAPVG